MWMRIAPNIDGSGVRTRAARFVRVRACFGAAVACASPSFAQPGAHFAEALARKGLCGVEERDGANGTGHAATGRDLHFPSASTLGCTRGHR